MRQRFLVVALLGLTAALGLTVPAASAQSGCPATASNPYPPTSASVQLSSTEVAPGAQITVSGTCFTPNSVVGLEFQSAPVSLGAAQTNAAGSFSRTVTIPADATPGRHTIVASDGRFTQTATLNVLGGGGDGGGLPRTGAAFTVPFGLGGTGLIVVGTLAVLAARRKRAAA